MKNLTIGIKTKKPLAERQKLVNIILTKIDNNKKFYLYEILEKEPKSKEIINYIDNICENNINEIEIVGVIYYLDYVSTLNQNKLLKTIEDMQNKIQIFFFENETKILSTIQSRIMIYDLDQESIKIDKKYSYLNASQINYLNNNLQIAKVFKDIYNNLNKKNIKHAFIITKCHLKHMQKIEKEILLIIILYYLKENKLFNKFKKIQLLEMNIYNNIDENLLINEFFAILLKDNDEN